MQLHNEMQKNENEKHYLMLVSSRQTYFVI